MRKPRGMVTRVTGGIELTVLVLGALFNVHVFELAGFEDLAAFLALDELRLLIAAHDLDARVLAGRFNCGFWRRDGRL
jgi:hypothetical protein